MELKENSCPLHWREIRGFCEDCKVPICSRCKEHKEHNYVTLEDYVKENGAQITHVPLSNKLKKEVQAQLENKSKECAELQAKRRAELRLLEEANRFLYEKERIEDDFRALHEIQEFIKSRTESAFMKSFKDVCEKGLKQFDAEITLKQEVTNAEQAVHQHTANIKQISDDINQRGVQLLRLDAVKKSLEIGVKDYNTMLYLLLLRDTGVLDGKYFTRSIEVGEFSAFPHVRKVFEIDRVMKQEIVDIGMGIRMSLPVAIHQKFCRPSGCFVSLSPYGVLAFAHSEGVIFTNLLENNEVEIGVEDKTSVVFYDDNVIFITNGRPLREESASLIFSSPTEVTLKQLHSAKTCPYTHTTQIQVTRELFYVPFDQIGMCKYNVDMHTNLHIYTNKRVTSIASLTGITMESVEAIFTCEDRFTYILWRNMEITTLPIQSDGKYDKLTSVLPSRTNGDKIKNALFRYVKYDMFGDYEKSYFKTRGKDLYGVFPFECYGCSLVRLYKDVFLVRDWCSNTWVICRIIVT